jgi:hypothetical protein
LELDYLYNYMDEIRSQNPDIHLEIISGINHLKKYSNLKYSMRSKSLFNVSKHLANNFMKYDLNLLNYKLKKDDILTEFNDSDTDIIYLVNRMRSISTSTRNIDAESHFEASFKILDNNAWEFFSKSNNYNYRIIVTGRFFLMWHDSIPSIYIGPITYLDYLYTIADISLNMKIILATQDFESFHKLIRFILKQIYSTHEHNMLVDFFKNYESLCLYASDIRSEGVVNWTPILDCVRSMLTIANQLSIKQTTMEESLTYLCGRNFGSLGDNLLIELLSILSHLDEYELAEASELHKCCFFAEVNNKKGIEKLFKRTHTPRPIDEVYLKGLIGITIRDFIIGFVKKEKILPLMIEPPTKIVEIRQYFVEDKIEELKDRHPVWFSNIRLGKTLKKRDAGHPVEYAKDKGAIKDNIGFSPLDNERELLQVIKTPHYEANDIIAELSEELVPSVVYHCKSNFKNLKAKLAARLVDKEKEQKIEGRNFGVASAKTKHGLSKLMEMAKVFLSYFEDSYLTMGDKERKKHFHDLSQELLKPSKVAIMLDIEGHNQSMQPINTYDILETVGNTFGEEGWGKLSKLFNQSIIYKYDEYINDVWISTGQLGGIEGWMNPIWTLVTLQQQKLLSHNTDIDIDAMASYSDDIMLVVDLPDLKQITLKNTLSKISNDLIKGGFIMKASQTGISKSRSTMLRQHYINGERIQNVLKRVLSITTASSQDLIAEEIEIKSISSSCSSALEGSYRIITPLYIKWFKSIYISFRSFASLFSKRRDNTLISSSELPPNLSSRLYHNESPHNLDSPDFNTETEVSMVMKLERLYYHGGGPIEQILLGNWFSLNYSMSLEDIKEVSRTDAILYMLPYESYLAELWFLFLCIPSTLGGLGSELAINQVLTGHSDHILKSLHYIHLTIKTTFIYKTELYRVLDAVIAHRSYISDQDIDYKDDSEVSALTSHSITAQTLESRLISDKWLLGGNIVDVNTAIKNKMKRQLMRINKNEKMATLLNIVKDSNKISREIIEIFRTNMSIRVSQFYYENTILSLIHHLIKKLQDSKSLLNSIKDMKNFKLSLSLRSRDNFLKMLSVSKNTNYVVNSDTDILTLLIQRRKKLVPGLTLIDIEEPLYDGMLEETIDTNSLIIVHSARRSVYRDGYLFNKQGLLSSETLFKGEIEPEQQILETDEDMLIAKLLAITKWAMTKVDKDDIDNNGLDNYDFVKACNLCLKTIGNHTYRSLMDLIPYTNKGEILHRIPNQGFKNKVALRIYPNTSNLINVHLNQPRIFDQSLQDSNINFEYVRNLIKMRSICLYESTGYLPIIDTYDFKCLSNVYIVYEYEPKLTNYCPNYTGHSMLDANIRIIDQNTIYLYADSFMYSDKIIRANEIINEDLYSHVERNVAYIVQDIIVKYKQSIYHVYDTSENWLDNDSLLLPLRKMLSRLEPSYEEVSISELKEIVILNLSDYIDNRVRRSHGRYDESIYDQVQNQLICIRSNIDEEYSKLFNSLINLGKSRSKSDRNNLVSNMIKKYRNNKRIIGSSLLLDIMTQEGLILHIDTNKVIILNKETLDATEFIIRNNSEMTTVNEQKKIMIAVLGEDYLLKLLRQKRLMFMNKLKQGENELKIIFPKINLKEVRLDIEIINPELTPYLELMESNKYSIRDMTNINYDEYKKMQKTINLARNIVEIYGNPDVFSSPTGSEALICQSGLVNSLMSSNFIDDSKDTIFLTAGRGDSKLVCDHFDVRSKHYSRKDLYTAPKSVNGLIMDYEYDLNNYRTLDFLGIEEDIIIDISFIKGQRNNIWDSIINMLLDSHRVVVRSNSIDIPTERQFDDIKSICSNLYISSSNSRDVLTYQVYLIMIPKTRSSKIDKILTGDNNNLNEIIKPFLDIISFKNLVQEPIYNLNNSVFELMDSDIDINELISRNTSNLNQNEVIVSIQNLLSSELLNGPYFINNFTFNELVSKTGLLTNEVSIMHMKLVDEAMITNLSTGRLTSRNAHWNELMKNCYRDEDVCKEIDKDKLTNDRISIIARTHILKSYRVFFYSLNYLISLGIIEDIYGIDKLSDILHEYKKTNMIMNTKNDKSLRTAICSIIVAAAEGRYGEMLSYLLPMRESTQNERSTAYQRVKFYRKLSPLYNKIRSEGDVGRINLMNLEECRDIIKPILKSRIDKSVINHKDTINNEECSIIREKFNSWINGELTELIGDMTDILPKFELGYGLQNPIPEIPQERMNANNVSNVLGDKNLDLVIDTGLLRASIEGIMNKTTIGENLEDIINQYTLTHPKEEWFDDEFMYYDGWENE